MRRILPLFLPIVAGLWLHQSGASGQAPSPDIATFIQHLDSLRRAVSIPGLSVAVLKGRALVFAGGLGHADLEHGTLATAETPYNIASVAKPISAVVALRLVEQGTLDLDRPLASYSGWVEFCTEFSHQPSIFAEDLRCEPASHTLRQLLSHTAAQQPGTRFSYNPVLYSWASRPIMAAAGVPFSALVERYVFGPARMSRSARIHRDLPLRANLAQLLAPPYRVDSSGAIQRAPEPSPQGDGAAGGVIATVLDLARFDLALDEGKLISPASRAEMMTPLRSTAGDEFPYGLGWFVQQYQRHTVAWHSGWWPEAYSALYLKVPDLKLTFIILANSEGIWWHNPLDQASVERSAFAQAFFQAFLEGQSDP